MIHRQYNRDWGTSYSRPSIDPYVTSPVKKSWRRHCRDTIHTHSVTQSVPAQSCLLPVVCGVSRPTLHPRPSDHRLLLDYADYYIDSSWLGRSPTHPLYTGAVRTSCVLCDAQKIGAQEVRGTCLPPQTSALGPNANPITCVICTQLGHTEACRYGCSE